MKPFYLITLLLSIPVLAQHFDLQGHRGCRGLMPENSIQAMKRAVDLGVTTLEMDVVISKDHQALLSHEPFLSHEICKTADGNEISEKDEKAYNLYQMTYSEIKKCDCGSKIHPRFLSQEKMKTYKPLLSEIIDTIENYIKKKYPKRKIYYNIETKSDPGGDNNFHPAPDTFVDIMMAILKQKNISKRVYIQSFDVRTLQYIHKKYTTYKTVLLVENELPITENLKILGFKPTVYSPDFHLLDAQKVAFLHQKHIQVIPWTVNENDDIQKVKNYGVDGLISDYPDRYIKLYP